MAYAYTDPFAIRLPFMVYHVLFFTSVWGAKNEVELHVKGSISLYPWIYIRLTVTNANSRAENSADCGTVISSQYYKPLVRGVAIGDSLGSRYVYRMFDIDIEEGNSESLFISISWRIRLTAAIAKTPFNIQVWTNLSTIWQIMCGPVQVRSKSPMLRKRMEIMLAYQIPAVV
ncbi:hypothetical protein BGX38DRAFT_158944 [Terfezia claveryi]|nr:hypothetical protein BGX38DRAFT_158944 [Terfezia claveryi]